uniref:NADH-ubiquinone oxidoreductase chain 2 n=1 Tax=Neoachiropsetta milfordi TaxID=443798 RepID=A0A090AKJ1_9PLEU|nr:NADH dehydrogenase subunit 2 [Neoachiropsetta milfordi]BAP58978.1 NADH dehydrogenase subunit 2 [Neoachiropsetta milfordi]
MTPFIVLVVISTLTTGTLVVVSATNWLLVWMVLEINTIAVLPLMARSHSPRAVEATTKYFLTQSIAAALLLLGSLSNIFLTGHWNVMQVSHPLPVTIITLALAIKMGMAPTHAWLPEVLQGIDLSAGLILSTLQKLAPFAILLQLQPSDQTLIMGFGIASVLVGGWGGLNQTQLRKILAYSSIAHMGWMLLVLQFQPKLALLVFFIYLIMTTSMFLVFKLNHVTTIYGLGTSWSKSPILMVLTPLILLSLAGLPPLSGFMPKLMVLLEYTKQELYIVGVMAAFSALLSLYFYLRMAYAMGLTTFPSAISGLTSWRVSPKSSLPLSLSVTSVATVMLFPMAPAILACLTW